MENLYLLDIQVLGIANFNMKCLICGIGSLGSLLTKNIASDIRDEHTIIALDFDKVEERNVRANTQAYTSEMIGLPKTEALQYILHKMNRKIETIEEKITKDTIKNIVFPDSIQSPFGLVIDCFDNFEARSAITEACRTIPCVHVGFSPNFTWSILWNEGYVPPEDAKGLDICEMEGASSFVHMVAAIGSSVVLEYLTTRKKKELCGNRLLVREIK